MGIAIFIQHNLAHQRSLTLHNNCSNTQAEQFAIFKAMEIIKELNIADNVPRQIP
jgi:ribonuclease HI